MLVSFVYVVVCRLFALVLLLARGDALEGAGDPRAAARAVDSSPAGAAAARSTARDRLLLAALSRVLPRARGSAFVVHAGDAAALAPAAGRSPLDVSAPAAGPAADRRGGARADPAARAREQPAGAMSGSSASCASSAIDVSATLVRNVLARAGIPPAPQRDRLSWRSFLRAARGDRSSPATSSPSTPSGCGACTCSSSSRSAAAGSSTSPARATPTRRGCCSRRATC